MVFWGGTFIAGRFVAQDVGPFSAAFIRFVIASVFLLLMVRRAEGRLPPVRLAQVLPIIVIGMTGVFAYNVLFFSGLKLIGASRAALIIATSPIFITVLSCAFFHERLTRLKAVGVLVSVAGAAIVISRGNLAGIVGDHFGRGELFILGCVASWVAYSLAGKAAMSSVTPLVAVAYSCAVGTAALLVPALIEGLASDLADYSLRSWLCLGYLAVFGTVLGFYWYYDGIKRIGTMRAGQFINVVPVSAVVLAFLILGEPVTPSLLVGGLLVVSGVYLTNRPARAS